MATKSVLVLLGAALAGLIASYLGGLHPVGDSLAVGRPVLIVAVAGLAALVFALGRRLLGALAGLVAVAASVHVAALVFGLGSRAAASASASPVITVYSKNLLAVNADTAALAAHIVGSGADIVLLQEVSDLNRQVMDQVSPALPYQHVCRFSRWSGIALLSRWPLGETGCTATRAAAVARVQASTGPIWVTSVHLPWPWPFEQAARVEQVARLVEQHDGARIVAGDFNMVAWGQSVAQIARASGTRRLAGVARTYVLRGYPLGIDHMLTSGTGTVVTAPRLGSDHFGLIAQLRF